MAASRWKIADALPHREHPCTVALIENQRPEHSGDALGQRKLVSEPHRARDVYDKERLEVRGLPELTRIEPLGFCEPLPVHVAEIVTRLVVAILAELGAVAVKRAPMQPVAQAFDGAPRDELEVAQRRELGRGRYMRTGHRQEGFEVLGSGFVRVLGAGFEVLGSGSPLLLQTRGWAGMASSSRATIASAST